ncbi:MAG: class I SAM-dependent methyltransferase [Bacteroidota bacterium]|nr:class I SAM-dependent methyltransferase [Bacteroidota bacterium]
MEVLKSCPVCESEKQSEFLVCKDYTVSQKNFSIAECLDCGFKFTNPRPEKEHLGKYYKSSEYISHSNTKKGLVNSLYQLVRKYTLKKKLELINQLSDKGSILDIGCGTGEFLNVCKNNGWFSLGIEPDEDARLLAKNNYDLNIKDEAHVDLLESNSFDVITMWHVLEHVPDLNQRMKELYRLLKENGVIVIAVPNASSADAAFYGKFWAAYDVPRHLYHFSKKTIISLFEKYNMNCIKVLPMKFDSFYVSLLSEKYKKGKVNLFKGFINGLSSNLSSNEHGYSSQIYIFKKLQN